ncbi:MULTISPECIES: response regulator [unclassified Pantoea]|jgi:two-component system response regulator EvgA|uniref:response regulator n=1 Tax=unclassified Pantoea TaxID=2630326 RepID=UPI00177F69B5|nr:MULTISPECIES: response regulator [unclassified Pantoea]MBD9644556.1 response regulator [Pantoea sp. PNT02]WFL69563.1 response regulator [Pantoea sp. X85]WGK59612.1 response regulator [Pantoea sp. SS70]
MASILIIDDHPVARLAVRFLLEKDGHTVVAEAEEGHQALKMINEHHPDLIVLDLDIPGLSGIELIVKLRAAEYRGGILVLTARDDDHYLSRCMSTGADGFVGKRNNLEELGDAVRAVMRGYGYFPLKRRDNKGTNKMPEAEVDAIKNLSSREFQVLQHLARGMKVIDISEIMHISNKTVSTYKTRILTKLALNSTLELIDFARRHHLD